MHIPVIQNKYFKRMTYLIKTDMSVLFKIIIIKTNRHLEDICHFRKETVMTKVTSKLTARIKMSHHRNV